MVEHAQIGQVAARMKGHHMLWESSKHGRRTSMALLRKTMIDKLKFILLMALIQILEDSSPFLVFCYCLNCFGIHELVRKKLYVQQDWQILGKNINTVLWQN